MGQKDKATHLVGGNKIRTKSLGCRRPVASSRSSLCCDRLAVFRVLQSYLLQALLFTTDRQTRERELTGERYVCDSSKKK